MRFACRQPQARQQQLAVLGPAIRQMPLHHLRYNVAQLRDDRARFIDPPHMRITCGEDAVCDGSFRMFLNSQEKLSRRFVELSFEEIGRANYRYRRTDTFAWAQ